MLANCIVYTVEIIKYYLIMKHLLGFRIRRNALLSVFGAIVIGAFSAYVTVTEDNPMAMFLVYIFIEMFILIKEKASTIVLSTFWMMIVVAVLDRMFFAVIKFAAYKQQFETTIMKCSSSIITAIFFVLLIYIIKKRTKGEFVKIPKVYYIYVSLLTLAEGILTFMLEEIYDEYYGVKKIVLIFICAVVMIINIIIVLCLAVANDGYKQRDEINKRYLKTQAENYQYLMKKNEDIKKFRHDMKSHMLVMEQLNKQGEIQKLSEYISRVEESIHSNEKRMTVNNGIVDAILNQKLYEADKCGVDIVVEGELYEECNIAPYDLCVIFDNILKNAIEAAADTEEKSVYMMLDRNNEQIHIYLENSCQANQILKNGEYISSKEDKENHGYGLKNVKQSVEKCDGTISFKAEKGKFFTDIFIRCRDK